MKKYFKFLAYVLTITMILNLTMFYVNATNIFISNDIYNTVKEFISLKHYKTIDEDTIEIINIAELNSVNDGEFYGYLVDVKDENNNYAYLVIKTITNKVVEFAESKSIYAKSLEKNIVNSKQKLYYSPLEIWVEEGTKCINLTTDSIADKTDVIGLGDKKEETKQVLNYQTSNYRTSSVRTVTAYPDMDYIYNVPDYNQSGVYQCINTSILNVFAYWDANGLPNLITGSIDQARADIQACLIAAGGVGSNNSIPEAIDSYTTTNGNYYADVWNIWNPTFFDLQYEIYYGYPCLVGIPRHRYYDYKPHMTTGVGYEIIGGEEYAVVHDNHSSTPYDVLIEFFEVDFVCGIGIMDLNS